MRIGEIVETCSVSFVAEGDLHHAPPLGSLVTVRIEPTTQVFAVVSFAQTSGLEPGRRAMRRGTDDTYDAAIYREHPELLRTLRTVFQSVLVGWRDGAQVFQQLPPEPAPLHYSVQVCEPEYLSEFTNRLHYLRLLLNAPVEVAPTNLIVAHLKQVCDARGRDLDWLSAAARELATLLKDEHEMLMGILYAIDPGGW